MASVGNLGGPIVVAPLRVTTEIDCELADVFRTHAAFVFRMLRRLGVGDDAADDRLQDVFLIAHRRWKDLHPTVSVRSWLFGIARRVASHHRRGLRRAEKRLAAVPPNLDPRTPEQRLAELEAAQLVERFLGRLGEGKSIVFVLSELEGLTAPEVAHALSLNLNTVYSRIRACRLAFEREAQRFAACEQDKAHGTGIPPDP